MRTHYRDYVSNGSRVKDMKLYKNVVNPCLIDGDDNQYVLDVVAPPELHILMGVVTKVR